MSAEVLPFISKSPAAQIVSVTPELAEQWLGKNTQNRNLKKHHLTAMARDMANGKFQLNGETIKFDVTGKMLDGQNRCHAIILSKVAVDSFVITGLPTEVMGTIDSGSKRKFSDLLQIRGEDSTYSIAAISRRGFMWDQGRKVNNGAIIATNAEMDKWLGENPSAVDAARLASRLGGAKVLPPSVIGLCYVLFARLDADDAEFFLEHTARDAEYFLERGASTDDLRAAQPAFSLRKKIKSMREQHGGRVNETASLAYTILAWNSWRKGEDRHVYRTPRNGWGENLPEPK